MQLTKLEMSLLTTSSLLPVPMPSTKISSISSPLVPKRCNETEPAQFPEFWDVCHHLSVFDGVALPDQQTTFTQPTKVLQACDFVQVNVYVGLALISVSENHQATCLDCIRNPPSQPPEKLILTPSPTYPFEQVCADYFHIGHFSYLTIVDRFSGSICIYSFKANEVNSTTLQNIFRDLFVAYRVSYELSSDGGSQFMSESFQDFLKL